MRLGVSGQLRKHAPRTRRTNRGHRIHVGVPWRGHPTGQPPVATLIYELLDAHCDTVEMGADLASDVRWEAHLDYLRALQREGRAVLARMPVEHL
jgi:hypothetical protein